MIKISGDKISKKLELLIVQTEKKSIKMFNSFFLKKITPILIFYDRPADLSKAINRKIHEWEIAVTKGKTIHILNPEKNRSKHYNVRIFPKILIHEMSHVFYNDLIPNGTPYWLNEGLAYHFSGQEFKKLKTRAACQKALDYFNDFNEKLYLYGPNLTALFINEKGLNKIQQIVFQFSKSDKDKNTFQNLWKKI